MRDWLGPKECAAMLGIGLSTLREWGADVPRRGPPFNEYRGRKNIYRRYRRIDVDAFLENSRR